MLRDFEGFLRERRDLLERIAIVSGVTFTSGSLLFHFYSTLSPLDRILPVRLFYRRLDSALQESHNPERVNTFT